MDVKYMIHACPQRMWYVEEFLLPSMLAQGIQEDEIEIRNDTEGKGNIQSCMESFRDCGERDQERGVWHLQDDVLISRDFRAISREVSGPEIACGFACRNFGPSMQEKGRVPAQFMWYSFQCIYIPNKIAGECAEWFFDQAVRRSAYTTKIVEKRHDDWFFRQFILERHLDDRVVNLAPNIVDHVDFLIGGTVINPLRRIKINRAEFFNDQDLVEELAEKLKNRKQG